MSKKIKNKKINNENEKKIDIRRRRTILLVKNMTITNNKWSCIVVIYKIIQTWIKLWFLSKIKKWKWKIKLNRFVSC